jgi:deoxyribodipyrimidine photolyase-related protein
MPKNIKIPKLPPNQNKSDKKYIIESIKYIDKHFPNNYGSSNIDDFVYPISHKVAKKWLLYFIKNKLKYFGNYQDYIYKEDSFLFHSTLSSSINIGLINPQEICDIIKKYKKKIPINSYEGYIRQLFWREYQWFCYLYYDFNKTNYFGNNKKLSKDWYNGTTGIKPVDDAIITGFNTGYLHHILRLMVIGNYMNLSGISPKEGFKWFMEFSCDSYEWVMYQNVMDMVFFVSGGVTTRRPYISSSNYILNMSNYKKDEWCIKWDKKYHRFLKNKKSKLLKFRYYFRNL